LIKNMEKLKVKQINIVIDCEDAGIMAGFYSKLLGWEWTHPQQNGWAAITSPEGKVIAFQEVEGYRSPAWPWRPEKKHRQGQMLHLDFVVDDLQEAVRFAVRCGARLADPQYFKTSRTMLDPAGHPFCIDTEEPE